MKINKIYFLVIFPLVLLFLVITSAVTVADKEDKNIKDKKFTIESDITLAPQGDFNKNGEIDAGDIITFSYTITNTTDESYSRAILKTNIDRKQLNFIHAVRGATGLSDKDGTIVLKYVNIGSNEQQIISFDARINYFTEDKLVSTEPEFLASDKKSINKSPKKEVNAKKLSEEEIEKKIGKRNITKKEDKKDKASQQAVEPAEESTAEGTPIE